MPTPSVRLSDNVYRAVKNSEYSISEVARDGIEQAVIDDLVSVCWLCGGGISQKERRDWLDLDSYQQNIAVENIDSVTERSEALHEYRRVVDKVREVSNPDSMADRPYYAAIKDWLNIPDFPVEFCAACSEYVDEIRSRDIWATEISMPYSYRAVDLDLQNNLPFSGPIPELGYAAETAAVWHANHQAFQQSIYDPNLKPSEKHKEALFWWAARSRNKNIIGTNLHSWLVIALRSNAHCLRVGNAPQPVYTWALEAASDMPDDWRPGGGGHPPGIDLTSYESPYAGCPACGTHESFTEGGTHRSENMLPSEWYCEACFFGKKDCPSDNTDCGKMHPYVAGDWSRPTKVHLQCYECGEQETSDGLTEAFWDRYESLLDEIKRTIPQIR